MGESAKPIDASIGLFSDDQLGRVEAAYGLERLLVLPFFSLNKSIIDLRRRTETSRKVLVESEHRVLFLKELPWYCSSLEFASFQTDLLAQLHGLGAAVAKPLTTKSGHQFFHDRRTGSIFVLQPYLSGGSWRGSVEQASAAGQALANLHALSRQTQVTRLPGMRDVFDSAANLVDLLLEVGHESTTARQEIDDFVGLASNAIDQARSTAGSAGYGATPLPIHGDFNPFNLVFSEERLLCDSVIGIVDFDNACIDDPAHDIGESLVRFGWVKYKGLSSSYGPVPTSFDLPMLAAMLAGYREVGAAVLIAAKPLLPSVMTAVALELSAIGLLSSYYTYEDLPTLRRNATALPEMATRALLAIWDN